MNLIGINETIDIAVTKWPTDEQLKATIARTHELGGLAIINHIPWSNTTGQHLEQQTTTKHLPPTTQIQLIDATFFFLSFFCLEI